MRHLALTFVVAVFLGTSASTAQALIIYFDDFSGSGAVDLNGTAPDVRPGSETWVGRSGDSIAWKANGAKTANGLSNAFLPFSPTAGNVYTLSLDVNPDISSSSDWFSLGFTRLSAVDQNFSQGNVNAFGWMLNREDDASTSVIQTFLGGNTGGGASTNLNPDVVGPLNMSIVLDTNPLLWTVEWFVDGASIRGPVAFASNPDINFVAIGAYNNATGSVDNFLLTDAVVVPEPATLCLAILGTLGLGMRRRRAGA